MKIKEQVLKHPSDTVRSFGSSVHSVRTPGVRCNFRLRCGSGCYWPQKVALVWAPQGKSARTESFSASCLLERLWVGNSKRFQRNFGRNLYQNQTLTLPSRRAMSPGPWSPGMGRRGLFLLQLWDWEPPGWGPERFTGRLNTTWKHSVGKIWNGIQNKLPLQN